MDDDGTAVRCWKCGYEVRDVDNPRAYSDLSDAVADREAWLRARR